MKAVVFEIDEVAVPQGTMENARAGSNMARNSLREWLIGVELEKGRGQIGDDETIVSVRELASMGVLQKLTLG